MHNIRACATPRWVSFTETDDISSLRNVLLNDCVGCVILPHHSWLNHTQVDRFQSIIFFRKKKREIQCHNVFIINDCSFRSISSVSSVQSSVPYLENIFTHDEPQIRRKMNLSLWPVLFQIIVSMRTWLLKGGKLRKDERPFSKAKYLKYLKFSRWFVQEFI